MTDPNTAPTPQELHDPTPVFDSATPEPVTPAQPAYEQTQSPYAAPTTPAAPAYGAPVTPAAPQQPANPYGAAPNPYTQPTAPADSVPPAYVPGPTPPAANGYPTGAYGEPATPATPPAPAYGAPAPAPAPTYTTSTGQPYTGAPAYDQAPPAPLPNYAPMGQMPAANGEPPISMPWYGIGFGQAIKRFFTKYATFSGRASRSEFWWVFLFLTLISMVFSFLENMSDSAFFNVLSVLWNLAVIVPQIALSVRRLHDANLPGPWLLLPYGLAVLGAIVIAAGAAGAAFSIINGSGSGVGGSVGGLIFGIILLLGALGTEIYLFVKPSDPAGARFDSR